MKFEDIYDSARPYIASFIVLRMGTKIAMVKRKNTGWMDGFWALPSGKTDWHETYSYCALREANEEVGVTIDHKDLKFVHVSHRHAEDTNKGVFMDWVDMYFEAISWQGDPYNVEENKSETLSWLDLHNLPENVVPAQRFVLQQIAIGSAYSEFGW